MADLTTTEMKRADELKVGDSVRHYDLTGGDDEFSTVFHIEISQRNIFGVMDLQVMVGLTHYPDLDELHDARHARDVYVGCLPDTGWEVQS